MTRFRIETNLITAAYAACIVASVRSNLAYLGGKTGIVSPFLSMLAVTVSDGFLVITFLSYGRRRGWKVCDPLAGPECGCIYTVACVALLVLPFFATYAAWTMNR